MSISITNLAVICTKLQLLFQSFKILNRSILAYNTQNFAPFHFKINVLQCPNIVAFAFGTSVIGIANLKIRIFFAPQQMPPTIEVVTERASSLLPEAVLFRDVFGF